MIIKIIYQTFLSALFRNILWALNVSIYLICFYYFSNLFIFLLYFRVEVFHNYQIKCQYSLLYCMFR
jgi:hypothetical protein